MYVALCLYKKKSDRIHIQKSHARKGILVRLAANGVEVRRFPHVCGGVLMS